GSGVFDTKGLSFFVRAWQPRSGQTIRGSGMGVTTLRLVGASIPESNTFPVATDGSTLLHDFTISDLSIDCNVSGQLNSYVTCGAVAAVGQHIRIQRIRAINFGSRTQSYIENFVIGTAAGDASFAEAGKPGLDCVIEDCIAERPSPNPRNNSS